MNADNNKLFLCFVCLVFCACSPAPTAEVPSPNITEQAWYAESVTQLVTIHRDAEALLKSGKRDLAGARITEGQAIMTRVLTAPQPTLAAMEVCSDLDQLYATMLLSNHHYGWARLLFQKNQARWSSWKPQTAESERRKKQAEAGIAECDRAIPQ